MTFKGSAFSRLLRCCAAGAGIAASLWAVETKFWIQNSQAEFEKGTLKKLSLRSDGRLSLAPVFRELFDSSVPYLWALAEDSKGTLYTGGGGPGGSTAKLFAVDRAGKSRIVAELDGMEIHGIAVDKRDRVYAATSPDGKVYRIAPGGKPEVFYEPKAKYIWGIALNSKGDLFVATGDQGEIHRVTADGKGSVFFRTEETHARSIAIDLEDNVIAGTEPGGLIIRVSNTGEGFVLYQASKREVTAVAVSPKGAIFAAAVGSKPSTPSSAPLPSINLPIPPAQIQPSAGARAGAAAPPQPSLPPQMPSTSSVAGGSEVYRIDRDNYPQKIWSHPQHIAYAIGFDQQGRAVVGTGNQGNIYRIDSELTSTLLINAPPTQITAIASGANGRLYAASGNIGKVFQIGPEMEKQGTFESEPFDGGFFSYWGRLTWTGSANGGKVGFDTRSGNLDRPQKNWSAWSPVDPAGAKRVNSPSARFLQYRMTLSSATAGESPEIIQVETAYMAKNAPPQIEQVEITPANYKFQAPSTLGLANPTTLSLPALGSRQRPQSSAGISMDGLGSSSGNSMQLAKGNMGVRWAATDPNADELVYKVEIRGTGEREWKLLKDKIREKYVSWDATSYPDGDYRLRITATDAPANTIEHALSSQLESDAFLIDNTAPEIAALTGAKSGSKLTVRWSAKDASSIIEKAEYSVNGSEWVVVEPTTRLSDAPELTYALTIDAPAGAEHTVAVRVTDEFSNQAAGKAVIR